MRCQANIKRLLVTGLLLVLIVMSIYISSLVPGKFKVADWMSTVLLTYFIESVETIENREYPVIALSDCENNVLTYNDLKPYLNKIQPGTIFFISHGKIIRHFIPGYWTHTGFYLGTKKQMRDKFGAESSIYKLVQNFYRTGEEHLVIDSSYRKGCAVRGFMEMAKLQTQSTLRSILCVEPKIGTMQLSLILQNALAETGKKYDLNFSITDTSKVYCAELIYSPLKNAGITFNKRTLLLFWDILLPKDIVQEIMEQHRHEFNIKIWLKKNNNNVQNFVSNEIICLPTKIYNGI